MTESNLCECVSWARCETGPFLTLDHHPSCPKCNMPGEAAKIINDLLCALQWWADQEDGIPDECWGAYCRGRMFIGRPVTLNEGLERGEG